MHIVGTGTLFFFFSWFLFSRGNRLTTTGGSQGVKLPTGFLVVSTELRKVRHHELRSVRREPWKAHQGHTRI